MKTFETEGLRGVNLACANRDNAYDATLTEKKVEGIAAMLHEGCKVKTATGIEYTLKASELGGWGAYWNGFCVESYREDGNPNRGNNFIIEVLS